MKDTNHLYRCNYLFKTCYYLIGYVLYSFNILVYYINVREIRTGSTATVPASRQSSALSNVGESVNALLSMFCYCTINIKNIYLKF